MSEKTLRDVWTPDAEARVWRILMAVHLCDFNAADAAIAEIGGSPNDLCNFLRIFAVAAAGQLADLEGGPEAAAESAMRRVAGHLDRSCR